MFPRPSTHSAAIGPGCAGPSMAVPYPTELDRPRAPSVMRPTSGADAFAVDPAALPVAANPRQHTQNPYVTGTSVLAVTYKDGVVIAADTLASYGSTKRYKDFNRLAAVGRSTAVGASGELSDFQYLLRLLRELQDEEFAADDGAAALQPSEIHSYLSRVLYNRRNKFDPLWNSLVVGGVQNDGTPYLGTVGMIGTSYVDETIATGFGNHLARPIMREKHRPDMTLDEATALLRECLEVCYYRDKNSINKFRLANVTAAGVDVSEPFSIDTKWDYALFRDPSKNAPGTW